MTWPTALINTGNVNADTDSAAAARADILALMQAVNNMIAHGGDVPGMIRPWAGLGTPENHLPCNGTTRSRSAFSGLFAAISKTVTGSTTSGSATITVSEDLTSVVVPGCPISGAGIPAGAIVTELTASTVNISANATATGSGVSLVFAPWGVGDGSSTFNLPDLRGRTLIGMGYAAFNTTAVDLYRTSNTTSGSTAVTISVSSPIISVGIGVYGPGIAQGTTVASVSGTSIALSIPATATATGVQLRFAPIDVLRVGATGGSTQHTLSTAEMPSHTHDGNGRTDRNTVTGGSDQVLIKNATANALAPAVNATGGGLAHNNVQPSAVVNYIIRCY